ncbi:helix-turn-helix transcriptional regulator [Brenneria rubrifaciens]|uniref:XRE family transcriptional regulator n=1 Tax=Brenneria rubrifaciens TaxID=55213 RepID=A0A4P8QX83_9GAMM|nr:helix-turn-helix transcriptional regulator [Brenneria rubrifaciens]QCR10119.1 XRE family transcriptional regulator [Brenneria rubrifaciens]
MSIASQSPAAIAEALGERLKQARLNSNLTQTEVAALAGLSRKAVLNAEKGKVQLDALVAIMEVLNLTEQLDNFLPPQAISPIQLARLQGKQRQRASGQRKPKESKSHGDVQEW